MTVYWVRLHVWLNFDLSLLVRGLFPRSAPTWTKPKILEAFRRRPTLPRGKIKSLLNALIECQKVFQLDTKPCLIQHFYAKIGFHGDWNWTFKQHVSTDAKICLRLLSKKLHSCQYKNEPNMNYYINCKKSIRCLLIYFYVLHFGPRLWNTFKNSQILC